MKVKKLNSLRWYNWRWARRFVCAWRGECNATIFSTLESYIEERVYFSHKRDRVRIRTHSMRVGGGGACGGTTSALQVIYIYEFFFLKESSAGFYFSKQKNAKESIQSGLKSRFLKPRYDNQHSPRRLFSLCYGSSAPDDERFGNVNI